MRAFEPVFETIFTISCPKSLIPKNYGFQDRLDLIVFNCELRTANCEWAKKRIVVVFAATASTSSPLFINHPEALS
ncbi:hypothetical protein CK516_17840 [Nostoc sp. 'Peltigera malacea cyanobiont' DB3992]|nr:hypothetical protein CK516_17840 [Nostoc sp. 'Peltigera malacea cyanobiont' DB3992]